MKKVFISRNLSSDSIFRKLLSEKTVLTNLSLIDFSPLPFVSMPDVVWLFFYSKNGIKYYLSQVNLKQKLPMIAVMGTASAAYLKSDFMITADFTGDADPQAVAEQFFSLAKNQKVAFVQAKNSRKSVQNLADFNASDLIVYDNFAKVDFNLPAADILVFTSPMNAGAYFDRYSYLTGQHIIAIGETTANALKSIGLDDVIVAKKANEQSLADACLALI